VCCSLFILCPFACLALFFHILTLFSSLISSPVSLSSSFLSLPFFSFFPSYFAILYLSSTSLLPSPPHLSILHFSPPFSAYTLYSPPLLSILLLSTTFSSHPLSSFSCHFSYSLSSPSIVFSLFSNFSLLF
jgi:hypothetical protein